jgi:hypothetical protein
MNCSVRISDILASGCDLFFGTDVNVVERSSILQISMMHGYLL